MMLTERKARRSSLFMEAEFSCAAETRNPSTASRRNGSPHEVRIKVEAIGVNRTKSMWRNDKYIESPIFPAVLGYDAGIVDAVGKDFVDFDLGDIVSTIPAFSLNKYFTYEEVILAPDHDLRSLRPRCWDVRIPVRTSASAPHGLPGSAGRAP